METGQGISLIDVIIPFTIVLFIIAVGVVLLYTNFQKNLYRQELGQAQISAQNSQAAMQGLQKRVSQVRCASTMFADSWPRGRSTVSASRMKAS